MSPKGHGGRHLKDRRSWDRRPGDRRPGGARQPGDDRLILIIGRSTLVADALSAMSWPEGIAIQCLDRHEAGLLNVDRLRRAMDALSPDLIVNTSGFNSVEKAESARIFAQAHNHWAMADLAEVAGQRDLPLLHLSSDQVFSGAKPNLYSETDASDAVSVFGQSQAAGEAEIRAHCPRHVILRTGWLFGTRGHNPLRTMLSLGKRGGRLHVPSDQIGGPTPVRELSFALRHIALRLLEGDDGSYGTVHYCGQPASTWLDLAREAFRLAGAYRPEPEIIPLPPERFGVIGAGPRRVELDCGRAQRLFGLQQPDWKMALMACVEEICQMDAKSVDAKSAETKTAGPVTDARTDPAKPERRSWSSTWTTASGWNALELYQR